MYERTRRASGQKDRSVGAVGLLLPIANLHDQAGMIEVGISSGCWSEGLEAGKQGGKEAGRGSREGRRAIGKDEESAGISWTPNSEATVGRLKARTLCIGRKGCGTRWTRAALVPGP